MIRRNLIPPPRMTVSVWADKYRVLPSNSPEPGRYVTNRVPYFKEVMDAFSDVATRRIVVKSAAQIGKSEVLLNVTGYYAQLKPCNILLVQPTLADAEDFSKDRLSRMIADTRSLTPLFYDKVKTRDGAQTILSKFYRGGRVLLVGANSPSGLASRPIKVLLCDEVDRYPADCGEGDPVLIAEKRTSNFFDAKVGMFSTPTIKGMSRIDVEYDLGTQEEWSHCCPVCGEWHCLNWLDMTEAGWRCPSCREVFSEAVMRRAPQKYIAHNQSDVRSFYINGFASPWLSWSKIMREWREAKGDPLREAVVVNTRFGKSYEATTVEGNEEVYMNRRVRYGSEVPADVEALTAAVDVQNNRLEYEVVGWSAAKRYGISRGIIALDPTDTRSWSLLDEVLDRDYTTPSGRLKVVRTFVDSGYFTQRVYEYCRLNAHRGRLAIKGLGRVGVPLIHKYHVLNDKGLALVIVGVNEGKARVFNDLMRGVYVYPLEDGLLRRNYDRNYFEQLLAERAVVRRVGGLMQTVWEPLRSGIRNESLDLAVYNAACWETLKVVARPKGRTKYKELSIWN